MNQSEKCLERKKRNFNSHSCIEDTELIFLVTKAWKIEEEIERQELTGLSIKIKVENQPK